MALIEQPDAGGNTVRLLKINNFLYPPFSADVIEGVPDLEIREDDIIICAYPKAGTHWVWEIARYLLAGATTGVPLAEKDNCMIEWMPASSLDNLPSPRVLNTHLLFRQLPRQVKQKRCKIIYVNRNPKDLAVSCYHHHLKLSQFYNYEGTWDDFLPLFLNGQLDYGSWFDYVKDWEKTVQDNPDVPIYVTSYEKLKQVRYVSSRHGVSWTVRVVKNPVDEITELSQFIGGSSGRCDRQFAARVEEKCSFRSMKSRKGWFDMSNEGEAIMYRKGEVGDWKNWFSVLQNEAMDGYLKQYMSDAKTKFLYDLPRPPMSPTGTSDTVMGSSDSGGNADANMNIF
ncbi:sulfotransferase family cytosolic 1b member 1 [Plakobranchus ocellatus]|uniref:Sulfotransferase family cytosolic 1b member 1 n=1 Tax=Plakobranchus ocellatus TaxID=259542 RepID=A0AAV4AN20_9GAST|nr:sulfotransferase family cytosolic 1b member 1 [Plakobranchus ocellatus]